MTETIRLGTDEQSNNESMYFFRLVRASSSVRRSKSRNPSFDDEQLKIRWTVINESAGLSSMKLRDEDDQK